MYKKILILLLLLSTLFAVTAFADSSQISQTVLDSVIKSANYNIKIATGIMVIIFFLSIGYAGIVLNEIQLFTNDNPMKKGKSQSKLLSALAIALFSAESIFFGLLKKIYFGMVSFLLSTSGSSIDLNELTYKGALEAREFMLGVFGLLILSSILGFIFQFMKLATNADNPRERQKIIKSLWLLGIVAAVSGSVGLIVSLVI